MARVVATLDTVNLSSVNTRRSDPLIGKSPLVDTPLIERSEIDAPQTGTGEPLPREPDGGWPNSAAISGKDLEVVQCSLPVESAMSRQVDIAQGYNEYLRTRYYKKSQKK